MESVKRGARKGIFVLVKIISDYLDSHKIYLFK